ncbi:MAG TPA: 2-phospho-L-lactate guanylyltransferase [bacterium]|nr:2-phospho-L-lactate guanylyltransferase [bacterium]
MRARAIVPQKGLLGAKSRLEGVLSAVDRASLSLAALSHVCATLKAAPGVEGVVVMTPDATVRARAAAWGIPAIADPRPSFNDALEQTMRDGSASQAVLVVAADLPLLALSDVEAMLAVARPGRLVLAPSKEGTGTNAVIVPPGMVFHPAYGGGSLWAHHRGARAGGHEVVEVRRPGLAFDLDTETDLRALRYCDAFVPAAVPDVVRLGWR